MSCWLAGCWLLRSSLSRFSSFAGETRLYILRVVSRLGLAQARAALLLLLTLRGIPTMYSGDEIGMHDVPIPAEQARDPFRIIAPGVRRNRDPARTPMQWDSSLNAGCCLPTVEPWLPLPTDSKQTNVAAQRENPHSMLTLIHALLALRRTTPALNSGSYRPVESGHVDRFVYWRQFGHQRRLTVMNCPSQEQTVRLAETGSGQLSISTFLDREEPIELTTLHLRGNEGCIIALTDTME